MATHYDQHLKYDKANLNKQLRYFFDCNSFICYMQASLTWHWNKRIKTQIENIKGYQYLDQFLREGWWVQGIELDHFSSLPFKHEGQGHRAQGHELLHEHVHKQVLYNVVWGG